MPSLHPPLSILAVVQNLRRRLARVANISLFYSPELIFLINFINKNYFLRFTLIQQDFVWRILLIIQSKFYS